MLWMAGLTARDHAQTRELADVRQQTQNVELYLRELRHDVGRLSLLNQALWELIRGRLNLTDADLERMVHEVDLRDGVEDGAMTHGPLQCPTCGRISNSKHWKCLYCGQEFEKPLMG
jgi:hypothetical protein